MLQVVLGDFIRQLSKWCNREFGWLLIITWRSSCRRLVLYFLVPLSHSFISRLALEWWASTYWEHPRFPGRPSSDFAFQVSVLQNIKYQRVSKHLRECELHTTQAAQPALTVFQRVYLFDQNFSDGLFAFVDIVLADGLDNELLELSEFLGALGGDLGSHLLVVVLQLPNLL